MMRVTPQMTAKWVRAAFLVLLGLVILLYADKLVEDLETNFSEELDISFEWTWDLLRYLLWIFIAWLFIDAVLIIVLSFRTDAYTLSDVMDKLEGLQNREEPQTRIEPEEVEEVDEPEVEDEEGTPPPP